MVWSEDSSSDELDWVKQQSAERKAATVRRTSVSSSTSSFRIEDSDSDDVPLGQKRKSPAGKSPAKGKGKSPAKAAAAPEDAAEGGARKSKSRALATRLPLTIAPKVRRTTLLLESGDPSLDLSGDFGCIGRLGVNAKKPKAAPSADPDADERQGAVTLDLKGRVYQGDIVPCSTVCLVSVDGSRAKVEAVFSDYVQLQPPNQSIFDMETVQHGEFGSGFFDDGDDGAHFGASDDEVDAPLKQKRGGAKLGAGGKGGRGKKGGAKKGARKPAAKGAARKKR